MGGECDPPVDSSMQWGGWLRASPGRNASGKEESKSGATSNNSFSGEASQVRHDHPRVRDLPTKRNLNTEFARNSNTRTGERGRQDRGEVTSPNKARYSQEIPKGKDLRDGLESRREQDLRNKLME